MACFALFACSHADEPDPNQQNTQRTLLVYMVANNNLGSNGWDESDIKEMQTAVDAGALNGGRLLVYHADYRSDPELIELIAGEDPVVHRTYTYKDGMSVEAEHMRSIFSDMRAIAPNKEYGLVLWSHGTGWRETANSRATAAPMKPYSFGVDASSEMKVTSLASALEGQNFAFIYFDCCHMATIEVVYELRHVTPYIVASATELPIQGMRYDDNIPVFFTRDFNKESLITAANNTFSYYDSQTGSLRACTMAVIETGKLDALAQATRNIMETAPVLPDDYEKIWLSRPRSTGVTLYDFGDYIHALPVSPDLIKAWENAYANVVLYHDATPTYISLDLSTFNGLATFIVESADDSYTDGYRNQSWWKDVVSHNPQFN